MSHLSVNKVDEVQTQLNLTVKRYGKPLLMVAAVVLLAIVYGSAAEAADSGGNTEFDGAADKFQAWIQGNLGKAIALVALIFGAGVAAIKKDGTYLIMAIAISIGIGIIVGIINSSFSALI